jgi:CheY-like chemotaxis protein
MKAHEPHVVLCDIAMPHEDGFAFMRWIREEGRAVPVLAITAFGGGNNEERVLGAGFMGYIRKPVEPSDLTRAVAGAVTSA